MWHRRDWLKSALASAAPAWASARAVQAARLAAAWDDEHGRHHLGLLGVGGGTVRVLASIELPTRAHGLIVEPGGSVLAAARRPGDWLLRWSPRSARATWAWIEPDRRFNGHVLQDPAGRLLCSVETDLESGQGRVAVRDARTLERLADWATHGIDAHQMIFANDGSLLIANGGVPTPPETGRLKGDLARMDASLVRLDARSGERLGQWRLDDARLSIRHLARAADGLVGIALQAEHDSAPARAAAPLLALFDGRSLRTLASPLPLAGYGGDITATPDGFAVSAPRAGGVARWSNRGDWLGLTPLVEACALAEVDGRAWAGGRDELVQGIEGADGPRSPFEKLRLDNHWVLLPPG